MTLTALILSVVVSSYTSFKLRFKRALLQAKIQIAVARALSISPSDVRVQVFELDDGGYLPTIAITGKTYSSCSAKVEEAVKSVIETSQVADMYRWN